jgi:hypothetical protein
MRAADVVFADPDNGLETKVRATAKRGPKYAFYDDLEAFFSAGKSLVVYQHVSRAGTAEEQLAKRFGEIAERLGAARIWALWFRRISARFFFVIPQGKHFDCLFRQSQALLDGPWGRHFQARCLPPIHFSRPSDLLIQPGRDADGLAASGGR